MQITTRYTLGIQPPQLDALDSDTSASIYTANSFFSPFTFLSDETLPLIGPTSPTEFFGLGRS